MAEDPPQLELFTERGARSGPRQVAGVFEPTRLSQARVLAELTKQELAERIGVSAAAIGQYESGAVSPRAEHLPKLARVLGVPMEFFSTGRPVGRLDVADAHFRHLRSTRSKDRAKAVTQAEQVWELTYALEKRVVFPDALLPDLGDAVDPVLAARAVRKAWGMSAGPVPHLVATMESNGIVVCLIPLTNEAVTRVDAYSTSALDRPLVIVTPERATNIYRYRFTCAHELGHLVMHRRSIPGDRQQEREADAFAAEFLTPGDEIAPLLPTTVRLASLDRLSRDWGISVEALLRRMGELGLVSEASIRRGYQRLRMASTVALDEPIATYRGEVPTLLTDALELASAYGFSRRDLARELCWPDRFIATALGENDQRPRLRVVGTEQ